MTTETARQIVERSGSTPEERLAVIARLLRPLCRTCRQPLPTNGPDEGRITAEQAVALVRSSVEL